MVNALLFYVFVIYGSSFLLMFIILIRAVRKSPSEKYVEAFYMLAAFANSKSLSILAEGTRLFTEVKLDLYGLTLFNVSTMMNVISNVFLLHFGIEIITYRMSARNIYRVFPVLLFMGYVILYMFGIFDTVEADSIARFGFGYNGAILSSIACFSFYYSQRQIKDSKVLMGILATGIGLIFYSIFDGLAEEPIGDIPIQVFRMFSAIILAASSFYIARLFKEKKIQKVDYV